jgi:hypothetical protein
MFVSSSISVQKTSSVQKNIALHEDDGCRGTTSFADAFLVFQQARHTSHSSELYRAYPVGSTELAPTRRDSFFRRLPGDSRFTVLGPILRQYGRFPLNQAVDERSR